MKVERAKELLFKCISEDGSTTEDVFFLDEHDELQQGIEFDANDKEQLSTIGEMVDRIYYEALGFCGCGSPEGTCDYILTMLRMFHRSNSMMQTLFGSDSVSNGRQKLGMTEEQLDFILKWLDSVHLTDHGSSVYGSWLTDYGILVKNILKIRKEYDIGL